MGCSRLACHAIWAQLKVKNSDGTVALITEQKAVAIHLGPPPEELFDVSSNYTEVPPSRLMMRGWQAASGSTPKLTEAEQKKFNSLDAAYRERKSQ